MADWRATRHRATDKEALGAGVGSMRTGSPRSAKVKTAVLMSIASTSRPEPDFKLP